MHLWLAMEFWNCFVGFFFINFLPNLPFSENVTSNTIFCFNKLRKSLLIFTPSNMLFVKKNTVQASYYLSKTNYYNLNIFHRINSIGLDSMHNLSISSPCIRGQVAWVLVKVYSTYLSITMYLNNNIRISLMTYRA